MLADLPPDHDLVHLRAALPWVRNWTRAVDGGAHRGIWSRELARHFRFVEAFEPCPENFPHLLALAESTCITAHPCGLGNKRDTVRLLPGADNTGQWHVSGDGETQVELMPLDDANLDQVGLLKLDVEGYELFALKGAERTICTWRPVVIIEVNGLHQRYGVRDGEAEMWLMNRGYKLVEHIGRDLVWAC